MGRNCLLLTGLLTLLLVHLAFAGIPAPLRDVGVFSVIKVDAKNNLYIYEYSISNPQINNQITYIQIDISKPEHSLQLSSEGLVIEKGFNSEGKLLTATFDQEMQRIGHVMDKEIIPVGLKVPVVLKGSLNWSGGIATMGAVSWGGSEEVFISPGATLKDFVISSYGLPGIRNIVIQSTSIISEEDIPENVDLYTYLEGIYNSIAFKGKTIGPTAPPADFKPIEFLNNIISMKHEAYSLGWIKNKGIEQSLDAKLDAAKKKLSSGDTKTAKEILKAFINEVEAQGCKSYENCPEGKHLTSEAYALLKYNALYLIERL